MQVWTLPSLSALVLSLAIFDHISNDVKSLQVTAELSMRVMWCLGASVGSLGNACRAWHFVYILDLQVLNKIEFRNAWHAHLEKFTENELILDYVHESREINYLFHESQEYFPSRITGNNFVLSRFTAIRNKHSRLTKTPLSDPL